MNLTTTYELDQHVYAIWKSITKVHVPCQACNAVGTIEIHGNTYSCPNCYGRKKFPVNGQPVWKIMDEGEIYNIRVEIFSNDTHVLDTIQYMLNVDGKTSGTLWSQENVFGDREEALTECDIRNAREQK